MNATRTTVIVAACLFGAVWSGIRLRRFIPEPHLSGDTKDAVKLAMGTVATMAALVLGLLLSSAKSEYDAERKQVIQLAGKAAFLDRVLALYGPESEAARAQFHAAMQEMVRRVWPTEKGVRAQLAPDAPIGNDVYIAIEGLSPQNEIQRSLKTEAAELAMELGQVRSLLVAESVASISGPMLVVVVSWLVAIFLSFSVIAPPNATATLALIVSAFSVVGAFFLILELDDPFGGLIRIANGPILNALSQFTK